jgi:hypothetical protein
MQKQLLTAENLNLLYKTFIRLPPFSDLAMPEMEAFAKAHPDLQPGA